MKRLTLAVILALPIASAQAGVPEPVPGENPPTANPATKEPVKDPMKAPTGTAQNPTKYDDGQIVQTFDAWLNADLAQSRLAVSASTDADIKRFAQNMVTMHSADLQALKDLMAKTKIVGNPVPKADELKQSGEIALTKIKDAKGSAFDRQYIDNQVQLHADVLKFTNETALTSVTNPDLKAFLDNVKVSAQTHLDQARTLQARIQKAPVGI